MSCSGGFPARLSPQPRGPLLHLLSCFVPGVVRGPRTGTPFVFLLYLAPTHRTLLQSPPPRRSVGTLGREAGETEAPYKAVRGGEPPALRPPLQTLQGQVRPFHDVVLETLSRFSQAQAA